MSNSDDLQIEIAPTATDDVRLLIGELETVLAAEYPPDDGCVLDDGSTRPPHDAANVIDREAAGGWGCVTAAPRNCAWQVDRRKTMRAILALSLLITLCASAEAATAHHRRHVVVNPNQGFSERAVSGFAYAPDGPAVRQVPYPGQYDDQPSVYDNKYKNWGG
jgi:hypothetical protein